MTGINEKEKNGNKTEEKGEGDGGVIFYIRNEETCNQYVIPQA